VNGWGHLLAKIYHLLLAFYPSWFREEFGEEMQDVFVSMLTETQDADGEHSLRRFWREIRDWPLSVLQEHLRSRRRKMLQNGTNEKKPLPRNELLAALVLFLLPLLVSFINIFTTDSNLPQWLNYILLLFLWGCTIFAIGLAVVRRLPGWSLSYLGFVLVLGIPLLRYDYLWGWMYPYFLQTFGAMSHWSLSIRIIYNGIFVLIMLFSILISGLLLVNLFRLLPYTRSVWQRVRADWTQLSFMFYGGLVFAILLSFEEYQYEDIWKCVAWMCLAVGAWFYLRANEQKQRVLALIGGASGAMWTVIFAKWLLIPLQKWPSGYPVAPSEATRWVETSGELVSWAGILIILIAPALLNLLPPASGHVAPKDAGPVHV
jgi:hypothetical protein